MTLTVNSDQRWANSLKQFTITADIDSNSILVNNFITNNLFATSLTTNSLNVLSNCSLNSASINYINTGVPSPEPLQYYEGIFSQAVSYTPSSGSGAMTGTQRFTRIGRHVTMEFDFDSSITTSVAATISTATTIPARLRPSAPQYYIFNLTGGGATFCYLRIGTDGVITFGNQSLTLGGALQNFSSAATLIFQDSCIVYRCFN